MLYFFEQFENHYLLSLYLVGESFGVGFLLGGILTLLVIADYPWRGLPVYTRISSPSPSGDGDGAGEEHNPPPPSGGGDDRNKWKKWLFWVTTAVVTTGVGIAVGGYLGWGDPLFAWKQPTLFVAAAVDQAGRVIPGLTFTATEITPFVESLFPKVWSGATSLDTLMPKLLNAGVSPQNWGLVTRKLADLGAHPGPVIQAVVNNFPTGASEMSVRLALEVAVNDQVDTLLLEYATEFW